MGLCSAILSRATLMARVTLIRAHSAAEGFITDNYGWRWIFYLNVPVGLIALAFCSAVVTDPDYMKEAATVITSKDRKGNITVVETVVELKKAKERCEKAQ